MHEGELELADDAAARLIIGRFPEFALLPLRPVHASGTVNRIIRIGDELSARFPLLPATETALAAEAEAMSEFAQTCTVAAPQPVGIGEATSEYPSAWAVQTWVPGETASHDHHEASDSLAVDVAGLIVSLRTADARGRVFDGQGRGGVLTDHDEWIGLCVARSGHLLDAPRVQRLWRALRSVPPSGPDVMSHRDLTPFNLLVSGDRLVGVLDSGGFGPADPALDLVVAWHLFDGPRRRIIRDHLDSGDVDWLRGAAWALQQAMGLVWYYEDSNPDMSALGLSTMHRLLADADLASLL
ncbi:phosphotransferase [Microbacterium sp. ANT_H45B]|uniref:phosphotransferase n=1 Tax=Microbacterium sp. ANT_H45B TaxID=2597346 RepID=UPI0011F02AD5|nr:phosphotransferase [Microbacterium sp. ANT_H45B]KAA0961428.1 phosphotransferase [Microbacterium sp. ANT_H45B]